MPNSFAQMMELTCPQCGKNFSGEVWLIVDCSELEARNLSKQY